jgi:hypothetical protein
MATISALIALVAPTIDNSIFLAAAARAAKAIRPPHLLKRLLTLPLGAIELSELVEGKAFLELDAVSGHDWSGICVLLYA